MMKVQQSNAPYTPEPIFSSSDMREFEQVTRYIDVETYLKSFQPAFEYTSWQDAIDTYRYDPDNLAIAALKAFHAGNITVDQFSTALFLYDLLLNPNQNVHVQPLFDDNGALYPEAEEALKRTFERCRGILKKGSFENFLEKVRSCASSEQMFFYIEGAFEKETVTGRIVESSEVDALNFFTLGGTEYRMVPSFSMMQSFLRVCSDEDSVVEISPVVGLSTNEDILRCGKNNTRDMALPFVGVELPKEADGFAAPTYQDFRYHDFYHAILLSTVPEKFKRATIELAETILSCGNSIYVKIFYEKLVDMEHLYFSGPVPVDHPSIPQRFIWSVARFQKFALVNQSHSNWLRIASVVEEVVNKILSNNFCGRYDIKKLELQELMDGARKELIGHIGESRADGMINQFKPVDFWSQLLKRLD